MELLSRDLMTAWPVMCLESNKAIMSGNKSPKDQFGRLQLWIRVMLLVIINTALSAVGRYCCCDGAAGCAAAP